MAVDAQPKPRGFSTICLPISKDLYQQIIDAPPHFRRWLDQTFHDHPELFPAAFAQGYTLKDMRLSRKRGLRLRRIRCKATGAAFSIRPCFVLPYMTAWADQVANALFLRRFGVPFWALAHVFGRDRMFWYRLEVGLGRNSIVGTTCRQAEVPQHLVADEHHQTRDGQKNYIATTVAAGCCLGAALSQTAGADDLTKAYGVFRREAQDVQADYRPQTVNSDGWAATRQAWQTLFPLVVVLRCFLHGWLPIRDRAKHLGEVFRALSEKVWHAYHATCRRQLAQRLRRLREWAGRHVPSAVVLEEVRKLCSRKRAYAVAYDHPGGHRTSNMLDRVMRRMNHYFDAGQHLHGSKKAGERHCRAWALLHNFTPWGPEATRDNDGSESPAERLNQHCYHANWLQNLLVSASLAGFRR